MCVSLPLSLRWQFPLVAGRSPGKCGTEQQQSYLTKLSLNGDYVIELFSFPSPPQRPSHPEAAGLRHLAFEVDDIEAQVAELDRMGVAHEDIRTDATTGKRFIFFDDPDGQPLEMYEKS